MVETLLPVSLSLIGDDPNELAIVFNEVVSNRDMDIRNVPCRSEFEAIEKYCKPVIWSIVIYWVNPGIMGLTCIKIRRNTVHVRRAHKTQFGWECMVAQLSEAIRAAYPDRRIEWTKVSSDEESLQLSERMREWDEAEKSFVNGLIDPGSKWSIVA